jgi:hypothetical protein
MNANFMIDSLQGYGLQEKCIETVQQQGAQCKANEHGGENV